PYLLFFVSHGRPLYLHSFPTRRSSDLLLQESSVEALFLGVGVDRVDYTKGILERSWLLSGCWRNTPSIRRSLPLCRLVPQAARRSEEHTSELQSRFDLVCRLLLEKQDR